MAFSLIQYCQDVGLLNSHPLEHSEKEGEEDTEIEREIEESFMLIMNTKKVSHLRKISKFSFNFLVWDRLYTHSCVSGGSRR